MVELPWVAPELIAPQLTNNAEAFVFLYSSMDVGQGRRSLLALRPVRTINSGSFSLLAPELSADKPCFDNAWFGYFGYGLKHDLEHLPQDAPSYITLPDMWMTQFATILSFDHTAKTVTLYGRDDGISQQFRDFRISAEVYSPHYEISSLSSNMSKAEYHRKLSTLLEYIRAGDLYQANLTRKFYGTFSTPPDAMALFLRLCEVSPSPYSALIGWGENAVISSSPEQFLKITGAGQVTTRPIKGSVKRSADPAEDERLKHSLLASEKERAENLMIVDLIRNDLARSCEAGSVAVDRLYEVMSYKTVHHLTSTISGQKRKECSTLEVIKNCFPPGSMTGTPKIKAMEILSGLEGMARGVYSGALGWLGGDGSGELSVVIRTLIVQGNRFEFQVGGGIVADSDPESEWQETLLKAQGICTTLGISTESLARM